MSGEIKDTRTCEAIRDELAQLSLGTLFGRRRSEVLEHVESCMHCTATLEQLSTVADSLLLLAPELEPPLGFESRLAERLRPSATTHRPRRFVRASVLCAAAVILVALGFVLGTRSIPAGDHPAQSATTDLVRSNLTAHGRVLGEVVLSRGSPGWMFMSVNADPWSGTVKCQLTLAGGKVETIGEFRLSGGYGAWGAPLTSPARDVRAARLVAVDGSVVASARLST